MGHGREYPICLDRITGSINALTTGGSSEFEPRALTNDGLGLRTSFFPTLLPYSIPSLGMLRSNLKLIIQITVKDTIFVKQRIYVLLHVQEAHHLRLCQRT